MPTLLLEKHFVAGDDNRPTGEVTLYFYCPGCKGGHAFRLNRQDGNTQQPLWSWNGNMEKPTLTPSLLMYDPGPDGKQRKSICHLYVTDGKIQFLSDCQHALAGKTVPMVDLDIPFEQRP